MRGAGSWSRQTSVLMMYVVRQRYQKTYKLSSLLGFFWLKNTYRPEERLLNLFGENVEHVNRLCCQRQIGARNPLVLSQLGLAALLLLLNVDRDNTQSAATVLTCLCCNSAKNVNKH